MVTPLEACAVRPRRPSVRSLLGRLAGGVPSLNVTALAKWARRRFPHELPGSDLKPKEARANFIYNLIIKANIGNIGCRGREILIPFSR